MAERVRRPSQSPPTPEPLDGVVPEATSKRRRLLVLVGVVAVLALVALGRPLVLGTGAPAAEPTADVAPTVTTAAPPPVPAATAAIDAEVGMLSDWVANERKLQFLRPVPATLLDDAAFAERLGADELDDAARAEITELEGMFKALGLLDGSIDLVAEIEATGGDAVVGFYDTESGQLFVRGTEITPYTRAVLVHELTHALDDQHFGLARPALEDGDHEEAAAFQALVEGNAMRMEMRWIDRLPAADRASVVDADARAADGARGSFQPAYYFGYFPYLEGRAFAEAVADAGGEARIDRAFADPPTTTAEILVPERYLHGIGGALLTAPRAEGEEIESGMFGALALFLVLETAVSPEEAAVATVAWEGDSFVAWRDGERTCLKVRVLLDAPWDAAFTADLFERWAERQVDASVEAPGTVIVRTCR
jgi:hypothetical protein